MRNILLMIISLGFYNNVLACYGDKVPDATDRLDRCLKLAEQGDARAQYQLGDMYASGESVDIDIQAAQAWHLKAANNGYAEAQYALGSLYENSPGTTSSKSPTFSSRRSISNLGGLAELAAGANLGTTFDLCLEIGDGPIEAIKWYRLAAAQGHTGAQLKLGDIYDQGRGVPQDDMLAYMWFDIASKQKSKEALESRETIAARIDPEQRLEAQAWAEDWLLEFR